MNEPEPLPERREKTAKVCLHCKEVVGETGKDDTGAHYLHGQLCPVCGHYRKLPHLEKS